MRRIRYRVASSLDGYIAGPAGEYDWIIMDPDIDFGAIFAQFDTFLMGRHTYQLMASAGGGVQGKTLVFSRTLQAEHHPGVTIVAERIDETLRELRAEPGKDIWLFGGGSLFRSLLEIGQVDTVELAVIPILLGGGIPFLPVPAPRRSLKLTGQRTYGSGIVSLEYAVGPAPSGASKQRAAKRQRKTSNRRRSRT